jgi:hypothetical protein
MKAKIIALMVAVAVGFAYPALAQNPPSNTAQSKEKFDIDLSAFDGLSEFAVMKIEDLKFKVEDFDGIDVTGDVKALKTPNKLDLLFYEQKSGATSICYDFYSTETTNNEWLDCGLVPESPTGLYWVLSNNFKSFYIIQNGSYLDMTKFKLKANPSDTNEYIVQENGVDKYVMKDLKGKNLDEFYPLELLSQ